jgi:predicted MPP superfamily phosphohydrolase
LNEQRTISHSDGSLAILGVENWGTGRFSKYGRLEDAAHGAEEADVKLLLSHDPTHWEARVLPEHPDIDVTFAGHTHGFQFGVEVGSRKWSPFFRTPYKYWAGLYELNGQYLYVNRGFGYMMNMPLRIGIRPEITNIRLVRG